MNVNENQRKNWRTILYEIIFEAETPAGKLFDIVLIISILASVLVVMLDSVSGIRMKFGSSLLYLEWFFTILFSIEYMLRLICVEKRLRYAKSFFGLIDLLAILPTYISIIAVPTGIVTVELAKAGSQEKRTKTCPQCKTNGHDDDARFCKYCGTKL